MSIWLIGANGVFRGSPSTAWDRIGPFDYNVNALLLRDAIVIAGVNCGVWEIELATGRWKQRHDETATEVLSLARSSDPPGFLAGCPYGVAVGTPHQDGSVRWRFPFKTLRVNERFCNALLPLSTTAAKASGGNGTAILMGTESGILIADVSDSTLSRSSLIGVAVRALLEIDGRYYAGTDGRGVWCSEDGFTWHPSGEGSWGYTVFCLASDGSSAIAGTESGVLRESSSCKWRRCGPSVLVAAIAADSAIPGSWLAGCRPSGLWWTVDAGESWKQSGDFANVGAILEYA